MMHKLLKWLRGALAVGLTWAVLWIIIGLLIFAGISVIDPGQIDEGEGLSVALPILGLVGFLSGIGFAGLLSLGERRRSLHELSMGRVALWGMLGSAAVPILMRTDGSMSLVTGALGATFAMASLGLARRQTHEVSTDVA